MTKRPHEDSEVDCKRSKTEEEAERMLESDKCMMDALKNKYDGERTDKESDEIKRKYLISYMKKVIEKLPMSAAIMDASAEISSGDEFLKMYSVAKTCVHSELHMKKLLAFNSVFDMVTHIVGKGLHDHYVTPYLKNFMPEDSLNEAYESFRNALASEDCETSTELHCVAYLIQNEMEKDQPLKIPNPIFNRFTQQVKAASQYITSILSSLATKPILPPVITEEE